MTQIFSTPLEAEAAFYAAFAKTDLEAMMAVWAEDDDIACVHPLGGVLRGREAVIGSWRALFAQAPTATFLIEEQLRSQGERLAVHVVHEHIRSGGKGASARPPVVATNAYRLTDNGWRMVLHHVSPQRDGEPSAVPAKPTVH